MFRKVLVANRGEIAVRVIRALRELGIGSVAIHSEPDTKALHVRMADEARCLGGADPSENYLDIEGIVAAARDTGAEAVHPGYGFLAENPELPRALDEAGLVFIGPPADVLARTGDKLRAREAAAKAGVPVIPGTLAPADPAALHKAGAEVGYPLFVKAAAGGGGKGMRLVREATALQRAVEEARSEASSAFGDDRVYLEKFIEDARHVEVQILADHHSALVHLFERECSLQRRHQKIVEESPSPAMNDALRRELTEAALTAARTAGYVNAGTVEFLLDNANRFYFLEINARIQVEHPVTELVTGLDLVRLQIEIAAGLPLSFAQDDLRLRGHAIECRIYAEDPEAGFAPSPGRIALLRPPSGPGVRFDQGVASGSDVLGFYDPILAKIIVWAPDRPAAIARMARALGETTILGVRTPLEMLADMIRSERFRRGETTTRFVEDFLSTWSAARSADELAAFAAIARGWQREEGRSRAVGGSGTRSARWPTPWESLGPWDLGSSAPERKGGDR